MASKIGSSAALLCTTLHCVVLYCTAHNFTVLYYTAL